MITRIDTGKINELIGLGEELRVTVEKETLGIIGQNMRAEIYGKIWLNIVPIVQINLNVNRAMSW